MNQHLTEQQLIDYRFKLADESGASAARTHLDECEECRQRLEKLVRKFAALDLLRGEIGVSENLLSKTVENAVGNRGIGFQPMNHRQDADATKPHGQDARATSEMTSRARPGRVVWLYRLPAAGAVAAAVIVGVAVLLVSNSRQDNRIVPIVAPGLPAQNAAPAAPVDQEYAFRKDQPTPLVAESAEKAEPAAPAERSSLETALADAQPRATPGVAGRVGLAPPQPMSAPGGSVKAKGLGDGLVASEQGHRQAALDAATQRAQAAEVAEQRPFAPASAIELVVLPRRENVQLTIYNGADLTLVRERRNLTLKRGWNWLQFMWANTLIDPTSLSLEPLGYRDGVQVQQLVFPPRLRELGRWLIHSEVDGQVPFELTYFTSGLAWRAFYMGTLSLDERTMHLEGYVRISNGSGEDYEDAQTRLVVGRVHLLDQIADLAKRQYPYGSPKPHVFPGAAGGDKDVDAFKSLLKDADKLGVEHYITPKRKEIRKEGLSEYFLYTIEGTETIPNQWGKRLLSFEANDVPVTSLYKYDEERWGTGPIRFLSFANDEKHKLGQTPIPDGAVRIYGRAGEQGHLSYVGAMDVKYIPVNEEVELNLGPARLVEVKSILMDYKVENHTFDSQGNISGLDEVRTWRIEIANTRPLPVDIEVTRGFETPYWTLKPADAAVSYEKYDATHARFKLTIEPRSKRVFEYTVTTYHGLRKQSLVNNRSNERD